MSTNHGVVYTGSRSVEVREIPYPKFETPQGNKISHGVILKVVLTNICGSDQHMVRGRTSAPIGLVLGHEITGIVIEKGLDVETVEVGDLVSVPFNVSCGRCQNCKTQLTNVCLRVNDKPVGGAYGYVDMGGWIGGQAEYVMVPYADWVLLKFPDKDLAMKKVLDLALLTDILPTGYHACIRAGVTTGSTVYIAGAGPVGLSAAVSAFLLGAAVVIIGDLNKDRLQHARSFGCKTIDLSSKNPIKEELKKILGVDEVDCGIDCVGFEAKADTGHDQPAIVLNQLMEITHSGGAVGIPGLYVTEDPGAKDESAKHGSISINFGKGWSKALSFHTGQTPVMRYNRELMMAILNERIHPAKAVNVELIRLQDAPRAYKEFDQGVPKKFIIDPHGMVLK